MKITRVWAMPNKWTFTIKPIKDLLLEEILYKEKWVDPFGGAYDSEIILPERFIIKNDIDKNMRASFHQDALEFLKTRMNNEFYGSIYDPPYSITQARQYGKKEYASMKYWAECKNELARIIRPVGIVMDWVKEEDFISQEFY